MAITGSGTQGDPWIVHNYSEIKNCIGNMDSSAKYYVKLANDIDCNDYGSTFEWETVGVLNSYVQYDFDLDGHTIKNFKVKSNNQVFRFGGNQASTVKNGKILNVYLGNSKGFMPDYIGSVYEFSSFENLSISINTGSGIERGYDVFYRTKIKECAIYIEGALPDSTTILSTHNAGATVEDSDFMFNVSYAKSIEEFASGTGNVKRCRFRGTIANTSGDYLLRGGAENSVIDLNTAVHYSAYSDFTTNNSTVINKTKAYNMSYFQNMIQVTSAEIINGDALRAKGFEVVNVSE